MNQSNQNEANGSYGDPYKWSSIGFLVLIVGTLPIILGIVVYAVPGESVVGGGSESVAVSGMGVGGLSAGELVYQNTCMVCHGPEGEGVVGLGKPVRNSAYVQESDDAELFSNIAEGRMPDDPLNTTGMVMPARGAQNISDDQVKDVILYLRSMQDASQPYANMDAWIVDRSSSVEIEVAFDGPGRDLFLAMCSSCHGLNGEGMDGLGVPFTTSTFVRDSTDKEIITMVKMGRPIWDAANTTGIDMPSKGGNPAMSDEELKEIIAYMRSISTVD